MNKNEENGRAGRIYSTQGYCYIRRTGVGSKKYIDSGGVFS